MRKSNFKSKAPLGDYKHSFGALQLVERSDLALVSLAVPLGENNGVASAVKKAWKVALPAAGKSTIGAKKMRVISSAPDQYMLQFASDNPCADVEINKALNEAGYLTNQTHAWVVLEISGLGVRDALARICPIDLHEVAFAVNDVARTIMEHMGAIIIRTGKDTFLLMSPSSSAISFLHAIETSILNAAS